MEDSIVVGIDEQAARLLWLPLWKRGIEGDFSMLLYNPHLKQKARTLRGNQTDSEQRLWSRLRRKQLLGVQFYRQKPIGKYIADFCAPRARLVIEVDGSQHLEVEGVRRDAERTAFLERQGLMVLRFTDSEVLKELESVLEKIHAVLLERINPP